MRNTYQNPALEQLRDQQVRYAPREKKIEQINRTEKLLAELEADRTYTYEYLCYRVTDYRPKAAVNMPIAGEVARHDLQLLVEDVSDAAELKVEDAHEPVHTVEDLSKMFNVSSKTISRWRKQGLVSRRFLFGGRKRVGFLQSSVDQFVKQNGSRVKRGERFSQLTKEEKSEIIDRARRLARAGGCPSEVSRRIAKHMNRSVETIRYTLKQFDADHPDLAVFPSESGPLTEEAKRKIYTLYRRGNSVDELAKRFCRTRTTIYRIANEMRAKRIMELPLDYMDSPEFHKPYAERRIVTGLPEPEHTPRRVRPPSGLPPYLASLYEVPLLTREQEQHLFRKFNFLKYKASKLRDKLKPSRAKSSQMEEIENLYDEIVKTKNQIVQANLRLVVSIAKRHVGASDDFFTLVSDGNMSLIRAAEKFDYTRGNKFSTYASWAIMKNFARTIPEEFKQKDRFRTSSEEMFSTAADEGLGVLEQEHAQNLREQQVRKILDRLDEREQQIIINRFGLDYSREPLTLKEVGAEMGVTKERVRQIEARALNKLRLAAKDAKIDLPETN